MYIEEIAAEMELIEEYRNARFEERATRGRRQLEKMNFLLDHVDRMGSECHCSFNNKSCLLNDAVWYADWGTDDPDDHKDRDAATVANSLQRLAKSGKIIIDQDAKEYNDRIAKDGPEFGGFRINKW
jgi:hypothetical protein